ncbi:hypothetical protein [Streptomyces sp. NBRC 109706]|uniref:hypothetical protein n=1 Tax=Streptomyces sp. NBRC 109706 TaxID=1550035 RepID=UPI00078360BF|nr:hypothetical protein [Streptomyces sp. NBRC 109706]
MPRSILRNTLGLAAAAAALCFAASPAVASPASTSAPGTGLVFYAADYSTPVAHFPNPSGECTAFPATAALLVGYSNVSDVTAYRTADCSGQATALGTLRSFEAGTFVSFRAS